MSIEFLQTFLLSNSFKALKDAFGVNARPSADGSKWSLNYDQLEAKPGCPVANVCRGLILRPEHPILEDRPVGPTEIVARPMDRFYNSDDSHAAPIDWFDPTLRIQEKVDGTMCILYFDFKKKEWCVATRAVPEADVSFGDPLGSPLKNNTFSDLFWYAAVETYAIAEPTKDLLDWTANLDPFLTYVFELTSPLNRIVVKYNDYRITFLTARQTCDGGYEDIPDCDALRRPQEWKLNSLADLVEFVNQADPAKCEGAVIVDGKHNRQKVKSKAWVLASRAKDMISMSKRNALAAVIDGTLNNVLPLLSDDNVIEYCTHLQIRFANWCTETDRLFAEFRQEPDRKFFALKVQASGQWQTPYFNLYSGKYGSVLNWLLTIQKTGKLTDSILDSLLEALG